MIDKDEKIVVGSYHDAKIRVWNWESGQELNQFTGHPESIHSVVIDSDRQNIVFLGYHPNMNKRTIRFHDLYTEEEYRRSLKYSDYVNRFLVNLDRAELIISSQSKITLCDLNTGRQVLAIEGESSSLGSAIAMGNNSKSTFLFNNNCDRDLKVWNLSAKRLLHILYGHTDNVESVAVSPDGKTLVSGSLDRTVKVWDLESGAERYTLGKYPDYITSVAFSSDGQTFASAGWDRTIRIFDLKWGEELCRLQDHVDFVTSIAFSPSGKILVSGSYDGTIKIWGINL
jgi:WD40 repeat protein